MHPGIVPAVDLEEASLIIGKTLGHYQITSRLGKGGMGEVYQAKDQKLGRDVAIKVMPEEFAQDTDRIACYQREAKLLASLNHPHGAIFSGQMSLYKSKLLNQRRTPCFLVNSAGLCHI